MAKYVELQRYPNSAAAGLVKGRLAQDDIAAEVRRGSRYQAMGGSGYVVSVPEQDLARARAIVDAVNPRVDLDEYVSPNNTSFRRCPACRSVMVDRQPLPPEKRRLVLATFGLAWLWIAKDFRCAKCGTTWSAR